MGTDRRGQLGAVTARLAEASPGSVDGAALVATALLVLWGYLLVASTGLVVNDVDAPLAVEGFDATTFLLAAAGVVAAWGLLAGRVLGYLGTLVVSWAGVLYAVRSGGSEAHGLWFWSAAAVVLVAAGLYLFASHDRYLPADGGSA